MGTPRKTPPRKVRVAVSPAMASLRETQEVLNRFWQTSELAYAYLLAEKSRLASNPARPAVEVLGYLKTSVWFPNNQGRLKLDGPIGRTIDRVADNTVQVYAATLLSFFAAFELYLDARAGPYRKGGTWGPFVRSLSHPRFRIDKYRIPLRTVVDADIVRLIRNLLMHDRAAVPSSTSDLVVAGWNKDLREAAQKAAWPDDDPYQTVTDALENFIGKAATNSSSGSRSGKHLPIELFYMLFAFTSIDNLAFGIEEALLGSRERTGFSVLRSSAAVKRDDLIVPRRTVFPRT